MHQMNIPVLRYPDISTLRNARIERTPASFTIRMYSEVSVIEVYVEQCVEMENGGTIVVGNILNICNSAHEFRVVLDDNGGSLAKIVPLEDGGL